MTDTVAPDPTPEQAALFARVRRMMLIAGLTSALAVAVVLIAVGYRLYRGEGSPVASSDVTAALPKGARIVSTHKDAKEELLPWTSMGVDAKLWENFLQCVKSRQQPVAPVDYAVRIQLPMSIAILSHRKSVVAKYDSASKTIIA